MTTTVYPSFYGAVHRAWNGFFTGTIFACDGGDPFEPDDHRCFEFAGSLRVGLHATGIRLSNDGWQAPEANIVTGSARLRRALPEVPASSYAPDSQPLDVQHAIIAGVPCSECGARIGEYHDADCSLGFYDALRAAPLSTFESMIVEPDPITPTRIAGLTVFVVVIALLALYVSTI